MTSSANSTSQPLPETGTTHPARRWLTISIIVLILAFVVIRWMLGVPLISTNFHGLEMQPAGNYPDFTLTSTTGETVSLHDFRGRVSLIYFGYTFCPDVCPTTLSKLAGAVQQLKPDQQAEIQVFMVTVDPQRDTPEKFGRYLAHFDPTFIGLTGTEEAIAAAADTFNIYYQRHPGTEASGYLVDHTASVAVLDKAGEWRLIFPYDLGSNQIAADLRLLLREGN